MTERYSRKKLNSRHCVFFSEPTKVENLYYYDFDTKSWRPVRPLDRLPYGLCSYVFLDEEDEERCVVTCTNSYRLTEDSSDVPSVEEMEEERLWREELVKEGAEMEYINDDATVYRAKVIWTKSDVIPGVVTGGHRRCPNINGFGYVYKESQQFAKTGEFLPLLTQEQLDKEAEEGRLADERRAAFDNEVKDLKQRLHRITQKGSDNSFTVYDTREWFRGLRKYPTPVTAKDVVDHVNSTSEKPITEESLGKSTNIAVMGLMTVAEDYDCCYTNVTIDIPKEMPVSPNVKYTTPEAEKEARERWEKSIYLGGFDFYFDIHVHGASYAHLWCGDGSLKTALEYKDRCFHMVGSDDGTFTFPDVTYNNPLHGAVMGSSLKLYTDGDTVTFNGGYVDQPPRDVLLGLENKWAISELNGRILLNGHAWTPSFSFPVEDVVQIKT